MSHLNLVVTTHLSLICDGQAVQSPHCYVDHLLSPEALHHGGLPDVLVRPVAQSGTGLLVNNRVIRDQYLK